MKQYITSLVKKYEDNILDIQFQIDNSFGAIDAIELKASKKAYSQVIEDLKIFIKENDKC